MEERSERVRKCIEEILVFTLQSHIDNKLGVELPFSTTFCSSLLLHNDPHCPNDTASSGFEGVPNHPLYKRLASALYHSILHGHASLRGAHHRKISTLFPKQHQPLQQQEEEEEEVAEQVKERQREWSELIAQKGRELLSVLENSIDNDIHVGEPYFSLLRDGVKVIEGRCAGGRYDKLKPGDLLLLNKCVVLQVEDIHQYASFLEMLQVESLEKVLPGVMTVEEGVKVYRKFYSEEREASHGVLAICVSRAHPQPYLSVASLFSGLGYGGIQNLLGLAHTAGTVYDLLPPSRSALISSFNSPYNPELKGGALSHGARALAKHAERSGDKYWGILSGNDSAKNRIAMDVIDRLISTCCWSNLHIVPQHGAVFEIRVSDGYGARWASDGTKFIGFLEPYTEDGHSKGWKH